MQGTEAARESQEKTQLMEAAVQVVKLEGPEALSREAVTRAAKLPATRVAELFADDETFILALHQHHLDTLLQHIGDATATLPATPLRMRVGITRFLDVSLRRARMRRALGRLKAGSPQIGAQIDQRHRAFSHMLATELATIGWPRPIESARLLRVMIEEVARAELHAHQELAALRAALWTYLKVDTIVARPGKGSRPAPRVA